MLELEGTLLRNARFGRLAAQALGPCSCPHRRRQRRARPSVVHNRCWIVVAGPDDLDQKQTLGFMLDRERSTAPSELGTSFVRPEALGTLLPTGV